MQETVYSELIKVYFQEKTSPNGYFRKIISTIILRELFPGPSTPRWVIEKDI